MAFLISAPTYIVPYMVIYSPELMLKGSLWAILFRVPTAFLGVCGMIMVFLGFCLKDLRWNQRLLMLAGSLLLIYHNFVINIIGYVMMGMNVAWQKYGYRVTSISKIE